MMRKLTSEESKQLLEYWDIASDDNNGKVLRKRCIRKILELAPEDMNAHLILIMLDLDGKNNAEAILGRLVELEKKAEAKITKNNLWEDKGEFWLLLATRPYMKILRCKLEIFKLLNRKQDFIALSERILELNTNDNLGVRYGLMSTFASIGDLENALRLYELYPESSTFFLFPLTYLYFCKGQADTAVKYLQKLHKENKYILDYYCDGLNSLENIKNPNIYSPGAESEAVVVLNENLYAFEDKTFRIFVEKAFLEGAI